jgi:YD repeat-containing protein
MNLELFKTMTSNQRKIYGDSLPDGTVKNENGLPETCKFTSCDDDAVHGWRQYIYNVKGKLLLFMNSDGTWEENTYDANGRPLAQRKSNGKWKEYIRDSKGRLLRVNHANGAWLEYTYDAKGKHLTTRSSDGHCHIHIRGRGQVSPEEFNNFINLTNPVKEYTHRQIEKLLGYKIKITNKERVPFFDGYGNCLV